MSMPSDDQAAAAPITAPARDVDAATIARLDAWWRAANYLSVGQIYLLGNPLLREPLAEEDVKVRLLGHWGTTPGLNFINAHCNRVILERDLDAMWIVGPGHGGPAAVANAWLEGTLSEVYPAVSQDEAGMAVPVQAVLVPGRCRLARDARDAGQHPRGRRARLCAVARLRGRLRRARPDRLLRGRRRRGRDRTAGGGLARQQVPEPADGRRGRPDPAPERLQDRQPDDPGAHPRGRAAGLLPRPRLRPDPGRGRRPGPRPPGDGRGPRSRPGRGGRHPDARPPRRQRRDADLADDRAAHAQGLDRAQGGRRQAGRGQLALPPGAVRRCPHGPGPARPARVVAAQLSARGALRRARASRGRRSSPCPPGAIAG